METTEQVTESNNEPTFSGGKFQGAAARDLSTVDLAGEFLSAVPGSEDRYRATDEIRRRGGCLVDGGRAVVPIGRRRMNAPSNA
jgi:hypothetical protein